MSALVTNRVMRVLIVDSDLDDRIRFAEALRTNRAPVPGWRIEINEANSASSAQQIIKDLHPDLVVIALHGQVTEYAELCRMIRQKDERRHTGIIFLANGDKVPHERLAVECLEMGADDFVLTQASVREILARIQVVLRMKVMTDELRSVNHRLEVLSMTDELTDLHNMRSFNVEYAALLTQVKEGKTGAAVMMMDLDYFKQVNDQNNHLMGSFVISQVGKLLKYSQVFGPQACMARYGGDEYIACLPAHNPEEVLQAAEKLRLIIGSAQFKKDKAMVQITASIGVGFVEAGFDGKADDVIKAADVMLYRSKAQGRNCVSGMILRYPVDFDSIGRAHLIEGNTGSDDHEIPGLNNLKISK